MSSKGEKGTQGVGVVILKRVARESPSDKLTIEQTPKGEEEGKLVVGRKEREGYSRKRKKQFQGPEAEQRGQNGPGTVDEERTVRCL